jgi:hypothetical protein
MQVADQGYCEDNVNFYVWFTTTFSTHQIDITFKGQPQPIQTQNQDLTFVYIIVIVVVAVGVPLEVLLLWKKPKKTGAQPPASAT